MNILFTICGRAGSKGIKNKNLKEFLGYPLSFYTVAAIDLFIRKHSLINCDIVLNTDSADLITLFKSRLNRPVEVVERKTDLAGDFTPKIAVIKDSYEEVMKKYHKDYDMIVDLDITSPLRTLKDLEALIDKKLNTDSDIVFSVTDARRNPYFNMVMKKGNEYKRVIESDINARQEAPELFDMNASLYAYSPDYLMSGGGIFESRFDIIKMLDTAVLDIDHENDFLLMEVIAKHLFEVSEDHKAIQDHIKNIMIS